MNIKNLIGSNPIVDKIKSVSSAPKSIKSESSSSERDANGQMMFQKQQKKQKMNREQVEKALQTLNAKAFMKDMHWVATLIDDNGFYYAEVKDPEGKIIRKISEHDMWDLLEVQSVETSKGNLLKRTA